MLKQMMLKQTMFKQTLNSLSLLVMGLAALAVSGCSNLNKDPNAPTPIDKTALDARLSQQETKLLSAINSCQQIQTRGLDKVSSQMAAIDKKVAAIDIKPKVERYIPQVTTQCPPSAIGDKFVLGAVESVFIDEIKSSFNTRIDTGAESSSLDARNIILFERDGDKWVRFDVFTNGPNAPAKTFESKVERFVRIKQEAGEKSRRRPVIHAHLQIGHYKAETDLNLTDRRNLEYPLLLGRKFMQDIAVVDVARTFIHGKNTNN